MLYYFLYVTFVLLLLFQTVYCLSSFFLFLCKIKKVCIDLDVIAISKKNHSAVVFILNLDQISFSILKRDAYHLYSSENQEYKTTDIRILSPYLKPKVLAFICNILSIYLSFLSCLFISLRS